MNSEMYIKDMKERGNNMKKETINELRKLINKAYEMGKIVKYHYILELWIF